MSNSFFGSSWKQFLTVTHDNRICLFDAETKVEKRSFVEKDHLTHSYTCFHWLGGKSDKDLFAAGASDNTVIVWDFNKGIVIKSFKCENVPSAIQFSSDQKIIYVTSSENAVSMYDVKSGEKIGTIKNGKKSVMCILCNPVDNIAAIATSSMVKLVELDKENGFQKKKCEGSFSGGLSSMNFSQCGKYLVCASKTSREIVVYDIEANSTSTATTPSKDEDDAGKIPIFKTLPIPGMAAQVQVHHHKQKKSLYIGVILEDKDAVIFQCNLGNKEKEASTCHVATKGLHLKAMKFEQDKHINVHVATNIGGSNSKVDFHSLECVDNKGNLVSELIIEDTSSVAAVAPAKKGETAEAHNTVVLGALDAGALVKPNVNRKRSLSSLSDESSKKVKFSGNEVGDDFSPLTLEKRLEMLNSTEWDEDESDDDEEAVVATNTDISMSAPTSDSLVTLLEQALQSGDDGLLEQCLACDDIDIIEETSKRLPVGKIILFLKKLVAKFEKRPSRGLLLTKWLSCILKYRLSYLLSIPNLAHQFAGLSQMLENRLSSYNRLASLAGRLDLLMGQVGNNEDTLDATTKKTKTKKEIKQAKINTYNSATVVYDN